MAHEHRPVRRIKTYTAQTGLVYQYMFVGRRRALSAEAPATEYVFDVSSDRKLTFAVSVFILDAAVASWAESHGRQLIDAEQYGAAKMRLLRAFDEVEDMLGRGRRLTTEATMLDDLLADLGID